LVTVHCATLVLAAAMKVMMAAASGRDFIAMVPGDLP
jgi:hypothetical protein